MSENQSVNPEVNADDDEIDGLIDEAISEESAEVISETTPDSVVAEDDDESDDDESDDESDENDIELADKLDLEALDSQLVTVIEVAKTLAEMHYNAYMKAHKVVKASEDIDKSVAKEWETPDAEDETTVSEHAKYEALIKQAEQIKTDALARIKADLSAGQDEEAVKNARTSRDSARKNYEAQVKYVNEQILAPNNVEGNFITVLPQLPAVKARSTGTQAGKGEGMKRPRVNVYQRPMNSTDDEAWEMVTQPVKVKATGATEERSSFSALQLWAKTNLSKDYTVQELQDLWYDASGTNGAETSRNPGDIKAAVNYYLQGGDGKGTVEIMVTPQESKK